MSFEISLKSTVSEKDSAPLNLSLTSSSGVSVFDVPISAKLPTMTLETPELRETSSALSTLTLRGTFQARGASETVEASVQIPEGLLVGIDIVQISSERISARIRHLTYGGGVSLDQCTVKCPKTGESRSGRNVCIECECAHGTIEICC